MNILRTCMLMEQIDQLHWLKEKLGHTDLPYKPYPFKTNEEENTARHQQLKEMAPDEKAQLGYLLNWTRDSSIYNVLEDRFLDEVKPDEPADIHTDDGPLFVRTKLENDAGKFKTCDSIDTEYQHFSWAAVPYWCYHGPDIHIENLHLSLIHWKDYDEDSSINMYVTSHKPEDSVLELLGNINDVNTYYIFVYSEDELNEYPGRIAEIKHSMVFGRKVGSHSPFDNAGGSWLKAVKSLLKDDHYEFILAQAISPEDDDDGDIAVHFLYHADK